nr:large proline-rich protein BAG6-like isoform X2 [Petromyzon marinus]XP_032829984.1 large proline-rich protein BAG6-like isoform X2 [Petromyzon marinus]
MPKLKFASGFIFAVMCACLWVGGGVGDIAGGLCQPSRRCPPLPPPPPPPPPVPRSRDSTPEAPHGGGVAGLGAGLRAACAGVGLAVLALLLVALARWKAAQLCSCRGLARRTSQQEPGLTMTFRADDVKTESEGRPPPPTETE